MVGERLRAAATRRWSARSAVSYWLYDVQGSHFSQGSVEGTEMLGGDCVDSRGKLGWDWVSSRGEEASTGGEATRVGGSSSSSPSSSPGSSPGPIWASVCSGPNAEPRSEKDQSKAFLTLINRRILPKVVFSIRLDIYSGNLRNMMRTLFFGNAL